MPWVRDDDGGEQAGAQDREASGLVLICLSNFLSAAQPSYNKAGTIEVVA